MRTFSNKQSFFVGNTNQDDRYRLVNLLASYGIREPILSAFDDIPREAFVEKKYTDLAYEDRPLPIGENQTISQPSLVAFTLQVLNITPQEKVLEVGTGSGFQTALLSQIAKEVVSIERLKTLSQKAKIRLDSLKIKNVNLQVGDGTNGYEKDSPYDVIIVSAAFHEVPNALVSQLKEGGRLVMPLGNTDWQELTLFIKKEGKIEVVRKITPVRFVPLIKD